MTHRNNELPDPSASPNPVAQAIAALTAAARGTRLIGQGTEHEHTEPADFGEIACYVLTAVAANIGGVEQLLSGRPGSWEADHVRQIIRSTAGDDDAQLLSFRTEPVRLILDVEGVFDSFGLYQLYEEAVENAAAEEDAANEALFEAVATEEERARVAAIQAEMPSFDRILDGEQELAIILNAEARTIRQRILDRAAESGHPLLAALTTAERVPVAVDELWAQDQAAYAEAYRKAAAATLAERGATVDVELLTAAPDLSSGIDALEWDELAEDLHEIARENTPLPMTGEIPDWSEGTPGDALRRAGLTYTARVQA